MRIAFLNRGRDNMPGGDLIQLDATMAALRARGHFVEETGWDRDRMRAGQFDLAHICHCNFSWSYGNYEAVRDVGLPYVLTPVYYPGPLLCGITRNQLHEIVDNAARVLPFSREERSQYDWSSVLQSSGSATELHKRWHPIPNGTDSAFHHDPAGVRFGVVVISARGDSDKNIPLVRDICARLSINLEVMAGISRAQLAKELRYFKVFVNASGSERMSLTIGEALCAGCRVLATQENWGNEWYPGLVTFDPTDERRLELLIKWALESPVWDYRPNAMALAITWEWVAEQLELVYTEVVSG